MTALSHADMRKLCATAFAQQFGRQGVTSELQCLQGVGWIETGYSASWHGAGIGSFNMGAIQKGPWTGEVFTYTDTNPNPDGTSTPYQISFRKYPTPFAGVVDLNQSVYVAFDRTARVLAAASRGDVLGFSTEMHRPPEYYAGFGATDQERIAHHYNAMLAAIHLQCAALSEEPPKLQPLPIINPALFLGCRGAAVEAWQKIVGALPIDGVFGSVTQVKTRAWQTAHGLPPSGIVCTPELIAAGLMPAPGS